MFQNLFNRYNKRIVAVVSVVLIAVSCGKEHGKLEEILKGPISVQVNPFRRVPLGGLLTFRTEEPCQVEIEVTGNAPIKKLYDDFEMHHSIPVLGLYADTINTVNIKLVTDKSDIYTGKIDLKTAPLPAFFPTIEISKIDRKKMEPGFHLVEMLIANNGKFLSYTIMFDDNGDIRWFMDMSDVGQIVYSALRIRSGNWLYLSWIDLWELSDLGEEVHHERMWKYAGDHDIIELSNGHLLMGGSKKDAGVVRGDGYKTPTRFDYVIEWDRKANRGVKEWDLGKNLDIDRSVYPPDYSIDTKADWFHLNSIALAPDSSLLVSGRHQGVIKVDKHNNVKWILAPHKGWGKAGREGKGFETSTYLLTAVDSLGNPYAKQVQLGNEGANGFEWSTGQHALTVLDNGNLLLFDNGLSRNLDAKPSYSRAVEYKINEKEKTVQQVWQYGKSRGLGMYSPITSDVDVLLKTNNRLITVGDIRHSADRPHAKMIEITYPDNQVVFEADIYFKDALGTGEKSWAQFDLVFRGERYSLYNDQ